MAHAKNHDYHILPPSIWPFVAAISAFLMLYGAVGWMHAGDVSLLGIPVSGPWLFLIGFVGVLYVMYSWWADVVRESQAGDHTPVVRIGLQYGFILFIISEVMFFAAWFWAFFKNALYPMGEMSPIKDGVWPPEGIVTFDPWHLPFINTLILLLSGTTVTWAHHAIVEGDRKTAGVALGLTVILGILFSCFQVYEYSHAHFGFKDGIYPSTFFMATGFHGFHVLIGTIFLAVCWFRVRSGHFTPKSHFGFEAAAWYWHFVDVVWLFLFVSIYWWGA